MPQSRKQSNPHAKWGAPVARNTVKRKGVRAAPSTPSRVVSKEVARDARTLVNHMRTIIQQSNPHLTMVEINYMLAQQLGIIKRK